MTEAKKAPVVQLSLKDKLKAKPARTKDLVFEVNGEELTLTFTALGANELDALRAKFPPTAKQKADGLGVNIEKFNIALACATLVDLDLTEEEATEIFLNGTWSAGEVSEIFAAAQEVCVAGLDVPSIAID